MKRSAYLLFLALIFALTACGKSDQNVNEKESEIERLAQEEPEPIEETYKSIAPLTGLGVNEDLPKRIVTVMINNAPEARPQSGLDKADIVYEVLSEGSITRFVSLYHSQQPKKIGPVRSIRPYYIDIASGFDSIMVHAGGSPAALTTLRNRGMAHLDEIYNAGSYFWRESFRRAPHNLYTDLEQIWTGSRTLGFREEATIPNVLFADPEAEVRGDAAETIQLRYPGGYRVSYEFDEDTGRYNRFTSGKAHTDLTTGEQLSATNVLVIFSRHRILDHEGRREVDVFGPGRGYIFQKGKGREIAWERKDGLIRAYAPDGKEIPMRPGNTWVNILPESSHIEEAIHFN